MPRIRRTFRVGLVDLQVQEKSSRTLRRWTKTRRSGFVLMDLPRKKLVGFFFEIPEIPNGWRVPLNDMSDFCSVFFLGAASC